MGFSGRFILHLFTILIIHNYYDGLTSTAQSVTFAQRFCYGDNYTINSMYQTNLYLLSSSISSFYNTLIDNGYYNTTVGQNPDTVYGSSQCRLDVTSIVCQNCVGTAARDLTKKWCPNSKQAIVWYDECMLRYSNQSYFSIVQGYPGYLMWEGDNKTDVSYFNQVLASLMDDLATEAVSDGFSLFATGEANLTIFKKIYGLVQCTSDVSASDCNKCLRVAITELPTCCKDREGGRVLYASCNIRYNIYPFFQSRVIPAPPLPPPPPPLVLTPPSPSPSPPAVNTTQSTNSKESKLVIIITVPSVVTVLSIVAILYLCSRRRKGTRQTRGVDEVQSTAPESLQFNFSTIRAATSNFFDANKLGEGGFGSVYKGTLSDGQEIAVKRLSRNSGQGEQEFKNEVVLLAKLQHRNLVKLLGFCLHGEERLLIYEFMQNGSLDQFIFDSTKRAYLDWDQRYNIIGGIARGLLYLHEDSRLKIIHRDLKASNILLGADMNPKISDFGMARLFVVDQTQAVTSRIVGTCGYMAPEYVLHGNFSVKSDVFSFGVLVLEILSGRKNTYSFISEVYQDLLSYAWRHWKNGTALELLDPTLRESCSRRKVMRCIHIGLLCVQEDVSHRPTMASIVLMLNSYSATLQLPSAPASFVSDESNSLHHPFGT